ncbi:hypothetical protein JL_186 [Bacillus phage JL]|uniref:Uncharacterized protein n=1 Tax=Bacillus phage JL TaxID=1296655 RepID=S5MAQ3_9CAUD|nr:hypothetical protein AVV47_gp110 [Bacillus phage JL]AGR46854.1 hypothetical protein JL_186 [Bacillus phage JL]
MNEFHMDIELFLAIDKFLLPGVKVGSLNMDVSANAGKPEGTVILSHLLVYKDGVSHVFLVDHSSNGITMALFDEKGCGAAPIPDGEERITKQVLQMMMAIASGEDVKDGTTH